MAAGPARERRRALDELIELAPGLFAVGALLLLAAVDGGFEKTITYPVGIFLTGLLVVILVVRRPRLIELARPAAVALGLLIAFTVWSFASIGWAEVGGIAFEAADRVLIFTVIFALFALIPWNSRTATVAMAAYAVGIGLIGAVYFLAAAGSEQAALSFINGRFAEPTNYVNAAAALFVGGFWPAVFLASRANLSWQLRGLLLAVAGLTLQLALLPQSRGAVYVFTIALLIYLLVAPLRIRALIALLAVLAATALASPAILDVFAVAEDGGDLGAALVAARDAMAISFLALLGIGMLNGLLDRRIHIPEGLRRRSRQALGTVAAVGALSLIAVALAAGPFDWFGDRWDDFKGGYESAEFGDTRFGAGLGSNRYDFWRVVVEEQFPASPIVGAGADNFAVDYIRHRASDEQPLFPHSLPLRILGGTGIVGLLLLAAAMVAILVAALRLRFAAGRDPASRGIAAVALASFAYWSLHSTGDWLWSFVAVSGVTFAWLGIAAALEARSVRPREPLEPSPPAARMVAPAILAAGLVGIVVLVALLPAWWSARDVSIAAQNWGSDVEAAYDRLDRARVLNPFSAEADLTAGSIASRLGDRRRAREAFSRTLEREPSNWYALLELGAVEALNGSLDRAVQHLERARRLNPRGHLIDRVRRRVGRHDPMSLKEVNGRLIATVCSVVGRTHETRYCE